MKRDCFRRLTPVRGRDNAFGVRFSLSSLGHLMRCSRHVNYEIVDE